MLSIEILFSSVLVLTVASGAVAVGLLLRDRNCRASRRLLIERFAYIAVMGASAIMAMLMAVGR